MDKNERRVPHQRIVANERFLANPGIFFGQNNAGLEEVPIEHIAARFTEPKMELGDSEMTLAWSSNFIDPLAIEMYSGFLGKRHNFDTLFVYFGVDEHPTDPQLNKPILIWKASWELKQKERAGA